MTYETPSQQPQNRAYEDYPIDRAVRRRYIKDIDGSVSGGWMETGTLIKDGVEHVRVTKPADTPDGTPHPDAHRIKDIPKDKLLADDGEIKEQLRGPREEKTAAAAVARVVEAPFVEEDDPNGVDGRNISRRELWAGMQTNEVPAASTEVPGGIISEIPDHILNPGPTGEPEPERFHY